MKRGYVCARIHHVSCAFILIAKQKDGCGLRDWTDGPTEAQKVEHLGSHVGTVGYHIRAYTGGKAETKEEKRRETRHWVSL
jgi:hypothetical protein